MKLRMLGDTLRLRLSRSEVERMGTQGRVEEVVHFGPEPDDQLRYALVSDAEARAMFARFSRGVISVFVPTAQVRHWASTDQVGLRVAQSIDGGRTLEILVEKDFRCLEPRPGEEAYDGFPNPKATC
jgi:hypothetical protein